MIELLYGEQIDFVRLADELGFEQWFLPQVLAVHASKRDLQVPSASEKHGRLITFPHERTLAREEHLLKR